MNRHFQSGFTAVEVIIASGMSIFIALGALSFASANLSFVANLNRRTEIQNLKNDAVTLLFSPQNWSASISNPGNWNPTGDVTNPNTGFKCLYHGTDCRQASGSFSIYSPGMVQPIYDTMNPASGFTLNGAPCVGFDSAIPNRDCPFRYDITWTPICKSAIDCFNPKVQVTGTFRGDLTMFGDTDPINPNRFNFVIYPKPFRDLIVSSKVLLQPLATSATSTYVNLDVDWKRKLAYLASRGANYCVAVIDFSNERDPTILKLIGPTTVPASGSGNCLGAQLYNDGTRLVVSGQGVGGVQIYDLGADPRELNWTLRSNIPLSWGKRLEIKSTPALTTLYVAHRYGLKVYTVPEPAGTPITEVASYLMGGCYGCAEQLNASTVVGDKYFLTGDYLGAGTPILQIDFLTSTLTNTFNLASPTVWHWSATKSADGTKAYVGGEGGGFLSYDPATSTVALRAEHKITPGSVIREATFVDDGGQSFLYTITNNRVLDVWNTTNISAPVLLYSNKIFQQASFPEGYGLRVDPTSKRAILVTNKSNFFVLDISQLGPATVERKEALALY